MSYIAQQTNFLPYQGVKVYPKPLLDDCGDLNAFCQPAEQEDTLAFQMEAWETSELVTDGQFNQVANLVNWTNSGWSLILNEHILNNSQTGAGLQQNNVFTAGNYYRITIDYGLQAQAIVNINYTNTGFGGIVNIKQFIQNDISKKTRTTYTFYWQALGTHLVLSGYGAAGAGAAARIFSISVIEIASHTDYTIEALDLNGVVQGTIPAADITQVERNIIINSIWSNMSLSDDCYQLRVTSAYDVFNDTFQDHFGWTLVNTTITGGVLAYNSGSSGLAFIDVLDIGVTYSIQFTVVGYVSGSVTVQAGNTLGTARTANGTYTETITCTSWGRLLFGFTSGELDIDNVVVSKINNIDGYSECFDLQDSHACTKLLKWKNAENIMGFVYSNNFEHSIRLLARSNGVRFPSDRLIGLNSAGLKSNVYSELRKVRVIELWYAREWVHDAIAGAFMHDTSLFDGIEYVLEDDYEPESPNPGREGTKYRGLMKGTLELDKKDQDLINRNE